MDYVALAKSIREGIVRVLPFAKSLAKLTSTTVDDDLIGFLEALLSCPEVMNDAVVKLKAEGKL